MGYYICRNVGGNCLSCCLSVKKKAMTTLMYKDIIFFITN